MPKVKENNCKCKFCGREFYTHPHQIKNGRGIYCSRECRDNARKTKRKSICIMCKKEFFAQQNVIKNGGGTCCSRHCFLNWLHEKRKPLLNCECSVCGKKFHKSISKLKDNNGKYCSRECSSIARQTFTVNKCLHCGREIVVTPSMIKKGYGKYCSRECVFLAMQPKIDNCICLNCNKSFYRHPSSIKYLSCKYCSVDCWMAVNRGENHANWNSSISQEERIAKRKTIEYSEWRNAVYKRDNYTCQHCKTRGGKLNAHHIIPWSVDKSLRLEVSNGITLCVDCHKKEHKRLSFAKNNQIDIFEIKQ